MSDIKIFSDDIEETALEQINKLVEQPAFKDSKIRIMPDVHAGKGCVIGFTADLGDKVIPNIVGVDIGCGMLTVKLKDRRIYFNKLQKVIEEKVPSGMNVHPGRIAKFPELQELYCYRELRDAKRLERSIGTLGGGNHFIEVDKDDNNDKYLIIHSGSRNLGKQVAEYYQSLAIDLRKGKDELFKARDELIESYKEQGRKSEIQGALKELYKKFNQKELDMPAELCYLTGEYRERYLHDMRICQTFAAGNRWHIARLIIEGMGWTPEYTFETIHNYIDLNSNIVRKGAISAKEGELVLIPMNMRDGCIIGIGKGNEDWNCSAPHGAGRVMSRTKAKETVKLEDFETAMEGIWSKSIVEETIDESPFAYRSIDAIISKLGETVDVVKIIRPIYNFKAKE